MYHVLKESHKNCIGLRINGKLTSGDYTTLAPMLEEVIKEFGSLRMLWQLDDFSGWDAKALWKDTAFDLKHAKEIERFAVVGESAWEQTMTALLKPLTQAQAQVRYFAPEDTAEAWEWLKAPQ